MLTAVVWFTPVCYVFACAYLALVICGRVLDAADKRRELARRLSFNTHDAEAPVSQKNYACCRHYRVFRKWLARFQRRED